MTMSASVSSPSSRTSGLVNAAWAGPRRPRTTISSTPEFGERVDRVVGGVGDVELGPRQREHPGDVGGDVAVADDDGALRREVELVVGEVGVGVVPVDELGRRVRSGQLLAGDPEAAIDRGPVGGDDRVVALLELGDGDVAADLDVAEELKALARRRLLIDADHRLDLRVVGGDAGADEAERGGEAVEHVDLDGDVLALEQVLGRVETGRPGADDRDPQRVVLASERDSSGARVEGLNSPERSNRVPLMRRAGMLALALVAALALAVTAASAQAAKFKLFRSPSGNIGCVIVKDGRSLRHSRAHLADAAEARRRATSTTAAGSRSDATAPAATSAPATRRSIRRPTCSATAIASARATSVARARPRACAASTSRPSTGSSSRATSFSLF